MCDQVGRIAIGTPPLQIPASGRVRSGRDRPDRSATAGSPRLLTPFTFSKAACLFPARFGPNPAPRSDGRVAAARQKRRGLWLPLVIIRLAQEAAAMVEGIDDERAAVGIGADVPRAARRRSRDRPGRPCRPGSRGWRSDGRSPCRPDRRCSLRGRSRARDRRSGTGLALRARRRPRRPEGACAPGTRCGSGAPARRPCRDGPSRNTPARHPSAQASARAENASRRRARRPRCPAPCAC